MKSELGREWIEKGGNQIAQMRVIKKLSDLTAWPAMNDAWNACLQPALFPTRSGSATMNAPLPNRRSILNYIFGRIFLEPFNWRLSGKTLNRFRQEVLGLKAQSRSHFLAAKRRLLTLQAYSPHVVPHADDWPTSVHTTGFMFLEEQHSWEPPPALVDFLNSGDQPICIGFGSMIGNNLENITRIVVEAIQMSGRRAVMLSGWAGIGDVELGNNIYRVEAAPHEWLFPRVSTVVHHGGAGSTASSLRAGLPTIIVPHLGDQPFWGQRVYALGVGPKHPSGDNN
jgi:UDP:flavonoid glycosyltransferase YjiC (YdhE family)